MSRLIFDKLLGAEYNGLKQGRLKFYNWDKPWKLGGKIAPTWRDIILSGNTALTLVNAKADSLEYLKLFGATEQRNIPSEYTQVNYVTNSDKTWLDTGVKFDFSKNYEIELRARGVLGSWYILQAREDATSPTQGISGSVSRNTIALSFCGSSIVGSQITRVYGNIYYVKGIINNGALTLYIKDETAGTEETVTGTYTPTTGQSVNIGLLGNGIISSGSRQVVDINSDVYFVRIKEDDNYILNYVSCRQDETAGFYDKASGTFKTTNHLVAGANTVPTPDTPIDIVCNNGVLKVNSQGQVYTDGTVETVEITGKNLFDGTITNWAYSNAKVTSKSSYRGITIPVETGKTYTFSRTSLPELSSSNRFIYFFTTEYPYVGLQVYNVTESTTSTMTKTFTVPDDMKYVVFYFDINNHDISQTGMMVELGSTATAEMLLKVGDYKDVQSVLDGVVTRNVGIKVFDGSEDWQTTSGGYYSLLKTYLGSNSIVLPSGSLNVLCTHYPIASTTAQNKILVGNSYVNWYVSNSFPTLASWKQYLADQYNADTPVIVVYPLATATTETLTAQPLSIQEGTNIVEITQASIDNLELEVKYKAGVTVTVTEIENAQLDNSVEVTVNG